MRPFRRDVPVLQAICSLDNRPLWLDNPQGLGPRDLAMHVALPELDGRIVTRPISFKGLAWRSERSESDVVCYLADDERMDFVAELARRWAELARKPNAEKRVALVLANYPTRDGRIGNGVGLDTPAAALNILRALRQQGYPVDGLPASGTELIRQCSAASATTWSISTYGPAPRAWRWTTTWPASHACRSAIARRCWRAGASRNRTRCSATDG